MSTEDEVNEQEEQPIIAHLPGLEVRAGTAHGKDGKFISGVGGSGGNTKKLKPGTPMQVMDSSKPMSKVALRDIRLNAAERHKTSAEWHKKPENAAHFKGHNAAEASKASIAAHEASHKAFMSGKHEDHAAAYTAHKTAAALHTKANHILGNDPSYYPNYKTGKTMPGHSLKGPKGEAHDMAGNHMPQYNNAHAHQAHGHEEHAKEHAKPHAWAVDYDKFPHAKTSAYNP